LGLQDRGGSQRGEGCRLELTCAVDRRRGRRRRVDLVDEVGELAAPGRAAGETRWWRWRFGFYGTTVYSRIVYLKKM
jgi:hypothetical protein